MGNDGGSIPTRRELVKEAARNPSTQEIKTSRQEQQSHNWSVDPISQDPLAPPILSDCTGRLYNKDSILEYLVEGKGDPTKGAVKGIKDVVEVNFFVDGDAWKCPLTGDRLGPNGVKAVYLVPCGHAFSAASIKEVADDKCPQCGETYAPNDVIPILSTAEEDIARLQLRIKTLSEKGLTHSLKKASSLGKKKRKQKEAETGKEKQAPGIKHAATATIAAKVVKEQAEMKKRKMEDETFKSLFSSNSNGKRQKNDFMTRGYSVT
ncbi:DUF602-domain-containing protein [Piedraia hortae CBS 480.64]|uniref:DUF602-domain-containing protein n=1 Tax=Piedraia hortae CBS 480.64 TaxID=1314780 RepID=A0A6A7C976_9PEZI|nr:DUF602-domain-containing protein [Piedraia hortae CBS 480.64]